MRTRIRSLVPRGGLLLLVATAFLVFAPPAMADLPPTPCTSDGTTTSCELWAMPGTVTTPDGAVVPVWGFAASEAGPAAVPGPLLLGTQGESMVVTLHNALAGETVALAFPGQEVFPDLDGVGSGGTVIYTFDLTNPGTFLYEAGMTDNGVRQVAMGLYGALVVRPAGAPNQAYDDVATAFDVEALLVLGEIDPVFNADPGAFEMYDYAPRYWLINGQAYPDVPEIEVEPGQKILLRTINAGLESHWMGLLGMRQQIIGFEGQPCPGPYDVVGETLIAGQTMDALATMPVTAVEDQRFALYDTNLLLHNASQRLASGDLAFGGMMTFLRAVTTTVAPPAGPVASNVLVSPNPTNGTEDVTLSADLASAIEVTAAEFFTNTLGAPGSGNPMTLVDGGATATIDAATLASWPSGFVAFYVRGQDASGWGPVGSAVLNLDMAGPQITGMSLSPEPTNGTQPVLLRATGDDRSTGRNNVVTATYTIDGVGPLPMLLNRIDNPVAALTATLTITDLGTLAEGLHPVSVTAQDSMGNWGVPGVITLTVDQSGPLAAAVSLTPDWLDLSGPPPVTSVRLDATITDVLAAGVQSPLANAEAFIDTIGADGTGFDLFASDGLFDEITEAVYFNIGIHNFLYRSQGDHYVYVHGLDAAGNWGAFGQAVITIDRGAEDLEGPGIPVLSVTFNPGARVPTVEVLGLATDPDLLSNVVGAEWFVDTDPGEGEGVALEAADGVFDSPNEVLVGTIDVSDWEVRTYTFYARALDSSGFWGPTASVTLRLEDNGVLIYLPLLTH
jgi:FtsP/CotA-like multicopper oxidase with cupredoxin domain